MAKPIRKIMCCCGSGLGSSLMVQMNIEKAVKNLGIEGIDEIDHTNVTGAQPNVADLFVVGKDLAPIFKEGYDRVVVLDKILSMDELTTKLEKAFASEDDKFWIGVE